MLVEEIIGFWLGLIATLWLMMWLLKKNDLNLGKGYCANLGHQEDETGLVYMRARYYEPSTGRFITEDPARDGVNWYLYADGNAVNRVDASGKEPDDDSFDPVYWFNWTWWWHLYNAAWGSLVTIPIRAAAGYRRGGLPGAIIMAGLGYLQATGLTAFLAYTIFGLINARHIAWYLYLFDDELQAHLLWNPLLDSGWRNQL